MTINCEFSLHGLTSELAIAWSTRDSTMKEAVEISSVDRISGFAVKFTTEAVTSSGEF